MTVAEGLSTHSNAYQSGYDRGFEDGQLIVQHSSALWQWALLMGGVGIGLALTWLLKHLT